MRCDSLYCSRAPEGREMREELDEDLRVPYHRTRTALSSSDCDALPVPTS
jgi:hypothetical protein